jgi:uncharacterized protein with GYD domain
MAKFLYRLRYTQTGLEGTIKEGFAKREAFFRERVASLGGKTEAAYWAYGDDDIVIVVDLPDAATATGLSLALARTGSFRVTTTVLMTAGEMDAGAARSPKYRAPGA